MGLSERKALSGRQLLPHASVNFRHTWRVKPWAGDGEDLGWDESYNPTDHTHKSTGRSLGKFRGWLVVKHALNPILLVTETLTQRNKCSK